MQHCAAVITASFLISSNSHVLETCLDSDGVPTLYTAKVPLCVAVGAFPSIYLPPQTEPLPSASLLSSAPTFQASLHPL